MFNWKAKEGSGNPRPSPGSSDSSCLLKDDGKIASCAINASNSSKNSVKALKKKTLTNDNSLICCSSTDSTTTIASASQPYNYSSNSTNVTLPVSVSTPMSSATASEDVITTTTAVPSGGWWFFNKNSQKKKSEKVRFAYYKLFCFTILFHFNVIKALYFVTLK